MPRFAGARVAVRGTPEAEAAMGVLTDIVVVDAEQAQDVLHAEVPSEAFPGFDAKGLDQIKLAVLRALLTGEEYDEEWVDNIPLVAGDEAGDGPWVFQLPDDIVAALADVPAADEAAIAAEWAESEEFAGWDGETVTGMLHELAALARRAGEANKKLLMWICL
jgi:hypothetical protein